MLISHRLTVPFAICVATAAVAALIAASAPLGVNYPGHGLDVDRTGDAVQALAEANFQRFFDTQPSIGPGSVVIRAPFAALAALSGELQEVPEKLQGVATHKLPGDVYASQERLYRFGVFPCLFALGVLGAFAAAAMRTRGRGAPAQLAVAGLLLAAPLWSNAIELGHPEEFLTAALTLGAALAAVQGRVTPAAVLLGVAIATKQWALLAAPAVVWAARPSSVGRTVAIVAATYLALMIPMAIGNPDRFQAAMRTPTGTHAFVDMQTIWFPVATKHDVRVFDGVEEVVLPRRRLPYTLESLIHPAIVLLAFVLSAAWLRRRPRPEQIFQLLALVFLLRCMLDPVTNAYYHAPFLVSLALHEGLTQRRLPVLSLLATAAFIPTFGWDLDGFQLGNAFYLAWSIPLAGLLATQLFWQAQPRRPKL